MNTIRDREKKDMLQHLNFMRWIEICNSNNQIQITKYTSSTNKFASLDYLITSGATKLLIECKNRDLSIKEGYGDVLVEFGSKIPTIKKAVKNGLKTLLLSFYSDGVVVTDFSRVIERNEANHMLYKLEKMKCRKNNTSDEMKYKDVIKLSLFARENNVSDNQSFVTNIKNI